MLKNTPIKGSVVEVRTVPPRKALNVLSLGRYYGRISRLFDKLERTPAGTQRHSELHAELESRLAELKRLGHPVPESAKEATDLLQETIR